MIRSATIAAAALLAVSAPAWAQSEKAGSSGSDAESSGAYPILPTDSTENLIAAREKWGTEPASSGASDGTSSKSKKKN